MKTLFVYKRAGLDTAEIRGRQIAVELGADALSMPELTLEVAARYDALVYVKRAPDPKLLAEVAKRGVRQFWDVLDNYSAWDLRRRAPYMDGLIGANLTHAVHLGRRFGKPSVCIPHHHCNFAEQRVPFRTPPVLGFISTPNHWPENQRMLRGLDLSIVSNISRKGERGFENLIHAYLAVDIGFTWRMESNKLRFNCANKLTNFMSFGIPSVLTPESGFLEVARHGETCFYAHEKADFLDLLRYLSEDDDLRRRMGDAAYEAARPFHISRIAERYREFLSAW